MALHDAHVFHKVLVLSRHAYNSLAAAALRSIAVRRLPLDIAVMRHGYHTGMALDEILQDDFVLGCNDLRPSFVSKPALDLQHLVLNDPFELCLVRQDLAEFFDQLFLLRKLLFNFYPLQSRKLTKRHIDNSLCLRLRQRKALLERTPCICHGFICPDRCNDLVYVIDRHGLSLKDMRTRLRPVEFKMHAPRHNLFLMFDIVA